MDEARAQQLLSAERLRIETALGRPTHEDDGEENDAPDFGNDASNLYQAELDEGRSDDLHEQLAAVERAEARLAAGTFGVSTKSGDPIPDERLEVVPWADRNVGEEPGGRG